MSSFSAYSSGFVANWSRASPMPFAVEIRYANVPSRSSIEARSAWSSVSPASRVSAI
jgi:hypothetical protein